MVLIIDLHAYFILTAVSSLTVVYPTVVLTAVFIPTVVYYILTVVSIIYMLFSLVLILLYEYTFMLIGEYGSTLYVGLARVVSPTNTNFRLTFLLTRLQEALYEDLVV